MKVVRQTRGELGTHEPAYPGRTGRGRADAPGFAVRRLYSGSPRIREARPLAALLLALSFALLPAGASAQDSIIVPNDWPLIPAGVEPGDEFRLLFLTFGARDAASKNIADYNKFVQDQARITGAAPAHAALRPHASKFRVVGSTASVSARANTSTTGGGGVPIYWVNGAKAADNYGDFYDGSWDSEEARGQAGKLRTSSEGTGIKVWTGSTDRGLKDVPLGGDTVTPDIATAGLLNSGSGTPLHGPNPAKTEKLHFYALSPVFQVKPAVRVVPYPGEASTITEGQDGAIGTGVLYRIEVIPRPSPGKFVEVSTQLTDDDTANFLAPKWERVYEFRRGNADDGSYFKTQVDRKTAIDGTISVRVVAAPPGYEIIGGPVTWTVKDDPDANYPLVTAGTRKVNTADTLTEVVEGQTIQSFTLTMAPWRSQDHPDNLTRITVNTIVTQSNGNFLRSNNQLIRRGFAENPSQPRERAINVGTLVDADVDNVDGSITLTILPGEGYSIGGASRSATVKVKNDPDATGRILRVKDISVIEGDDGVFTFEMDRAPEQGARFRLSASPFNSDQTASDSDYDYENPEDSWFSWPAGQTSTTFTVTTTDDNTHEPDETIHLVLSNPQKLGFGPDVTKLTAVATIMDDADLPTISLSSPSAREGGKLKFKAKLSNPSEFEVTAKYEDTGDGTAQSGTRYTALPADTVTFAAGDLEKEIVIDVLTDQVEQTVDETVILRLSQPANAAFPNEGRTIEATGIIRKDATLLPEVRLSETVQPVHEGEIAVFTAQVLVDGVVAPWDEDLSVIWFAVPHIDNDPEGATATWNADFRPINGVITIPAGKVGGPIRVDTRTDRIDEGSETLGIRIFGRTSRALFDFDADHWVFTTIHDDAAVLIRDAPETAEGNAMTFTVDLGAPAVDDVVLTWKTEDGTATAGEDYTAVTNGALTIPAGDQTATLSVATLQDPTDEPDQTLDVVLVKTAGTAREARMRATGVIRDDDARPQINIANVSVTEGATAQFRISLSAVSEKTVAGHWHTEDGSATAGEDYVAASGAFTIAPGDLHADISVVTTDDAYGEETEEFRVVLLRTPEATLAMGKATGAILDNDGGLTQTLSVSDAETQEDGDGNMTFTVRLSLPAKSPVSVDWKAPPNPFTGVDCGGASNPCVAAKSGGLSVDGLDDYTPVAATTLSFAVGEQEKEITVQVHDDNTSELDETLEVILENPVGATIADGTGIGTIVDNDRIEFWMTNESTDIPEGESLVVTVRRSRTHSGSARHEARPCLPLVNVEPGMATPSFPSSSSAGDDDVYLNDRFTSRNQCMQQSDLATFIWQWLYFYPDDLEASFTIYTIQDDRAEGDETFTVHVPGTFADGVLTDWLVQEFTIIDDDSRRLRVERREGALWEGEKVVFDLYTDPPLKAGESATVHYKTSDGTAVAGQDYTAHADTTLNLGPPSSPGASIATIEVMTTEDDALEDDETFTLTFHSPSVGLQLPAHGGEQILETILDDDRGDVSLKDVSVVEGGEARVALALSDAIDEEATVIWETVSGTAESPADFPAVADGSLTIAAGEMSATILAATTQDTDDEPDEEFQVRIKSITPADFRIGDAAAITIIDDDDATLEIGDIPAASVDENTAWSGTAPSVTGMPIGEVGWTIEGADAALFDVEADTGKLTLPAQDFEAPADRNKDNVYQVTLRATDEDGTTDTEAVTVTVTDVLYGVFEVLGFPFAANPASEKKEGKKQPLGLHYRRLPMAGGGKWPNERGSVRWRVVLKGSDPSDPLADSADFTGNTSGTVQVKPDGRFDFPSVQSTQDALDEPDEEHFQLELFDPAGDVGIKLRGQADAQAVYRQLIDAGILDDDDTPSFSVADASADEGDDVTFTVTRAGASANAVSVDWATALTTEDDAASADDFTHTPEAQTLSFAANETEKTVTVATTEDTLDESDETFEVKLSNPAKAEEDQGGTPTIAEDAAAATLTITDDDDPPELSVA
ncbi:MAG: hypothetical protein F4Z68_07135, partial [Nitrospira sp. SB0667_bin_9]|nr:hypothetical protein [Nitrospira sp. SB0667_bin_9]